MIRAAFFDIDGTLLSFQTHKVSPGTIRAFDALHRQGIRTFISSGRPQVLIPSLPVTFDGYITMNGGYCFVGDKVLLSNALPQDETNRWLRYAMQEGLCTMIFGEHDMYTNSSDHPLGRTILEQLGIAMPPVMPINEMMGHKTFQIIAVMPAEEDASVLKFLPHCRAPRWHPQFTDIIHCENSKARGIEALLRHYDIGAEETIAFGDGGNDIEMLEYCGIGVAMGNASDTVKEHANHVTTPVDDEGIEKALITLGIIRS